MKEQEFDSNSTKIIEASSVLVVQSTMTGMDFLNKSTAHIKERASSSDSTSSSPSNNTSISTNDYPYNETDEDSVETKIKTFTKKLNKKNLKSKHLKKRKNSKLTSDKVCSQALLAHHQIIPQYPQMIIHIMKQMKTQWRQR